MKKAKPDYILLGVVVFLLFFGILFLSGVSAIPSQVRTGKPTYFLFRHLLFGVLPGLILAFGAYKIKLSYLKKMAPVLFFLNLALLIAVFIPGLGIKAGGATRWLNLYFFSLQPSEMLKLTFILYLAAWFSSRSSSKEKNPVILPFFLIVSAIALILRLQPDMSTLGVIVATAIIIYFFTNVPFYRFAGISLLVIILFVSFIYFSDYRMERILLFMGLKDDPMGTGFQIKQSVISVGSGGIFGQGLGTYVEKTGFLPQVLGDSIFSVIAEEAGFLGGIVLVFSFLLFFWRGVKNAEGSKEEFSSLVAIGISSWICIQAFINIGAMIGLVPLTGIPLPFISYGGSHIISELVAVGILLNVSKYATIEK